MTRSSLGLAVGAMLLLATHASADRLVRAGIYCVSVEVSGTPTKALRAGERFPQISVVVSNRAKIEDERRIYAVGPLNDKVFRSLTALSADARICLAASLMTVRHGLDILFAWNLEECVDFECTNVPGYDDSVEQHPRRPAPQAPPLPPDSDPSKRKAAAGVPPIEPIKP